MQRWPEAHVAVPHRQGVSTDDSPNAEEETQAAMPVRPRLRLYMSLTSQDLLNTSCLLEEPFAVVEKKRW
jgi:hypothetical protein